MLERVGSLVGTATSPFTFVGAAARHARLFHPCGVSYQAQVTPIGTGSPAGRRLTGSALVRLSSALRRDGAGPDILGFAIRFGWNGGIDDEAFEPGQQDLLLATIRHVATIPGAFFRTDAEDFLANHYYGISRFCIDGFGKAKIRMRPLGRGLTGADKFERLASAVNKKQARFELSSGRFGVWTPLVRISLERRVDLDAGKLRFSPFHADKGIHPIGFLNAVRRAAYAGSQQGRWVFRK